MVQVVNQCVYYRIISDHSSLPCIVVFLSAESLFERCGSWLQPSLASLIETLSHTALPRQQHNPLSLNEAFNIRLSYNVLICPYSQSGEDITNNVAGQ